MEKHLDAIHSRLILPVQDCCLQLPFGLRFLIQALRRGESHPWRSLSASAYANANAGNCDRWKYGGAAHSRFTGQEINLICNRKFV